MYAYMSCSMRETNWELGVPGTRTGTLSMFCTPTGVQYSGLWTLYMQVPGYKYKYKYLVL